MCLGIPMEIISIDGDTARCRAFDIERDVNLFMLRDQQPRRGDYVLVHVGYAIQKIAVDEAEASLTLLDDLQEADRHA